MSRTRVAVFFGGRSPEHDVSVVSGLQILKAIDQSKYEPFAVYVTLEGHFLVGDVLSERENYMLSADTLKKTTEVMPDPVAGKTGRLVPKKQGLFGGSKDIEFDIALPVFHGLYGEDGNMQGLFELMNVPYAGMRTMASSILMDKAATKRILHDLDIPHLPYALIERPEAGYFVAKDVLEQAIGDLAFPLILKPVHLGSSIGVAKVNDLEELSACLPAVFEFDDVAIVEPFVPNLVEYNLAVSKISGAVKTSAIERPKATEELLDFKQKYLSGGANKNGDGSLKTPGSISEGMLSLTRELNPELSEEQEQNLRGWAMRIFTALNGAGAPRIDYMCNFETGEFWMNEINPIPGSYGYFLWEAASEPLLFSEFISGLLEEALVEHRRKSLPKDPVPKDARLFKR